MKLRYTVLFFSLFTLFISCEKEVSLNNFIEVDGKNIKLAKGFISNSASQNADSSWDKKLYFFTDGISIDQNTKEGKGLGDALELNISTLEKDILSNGIYTFTNDSSGAYFTSFDTISIYEASYIYYFKEGDLKIQENSYTFDFELENGKRLKGSYYGVLENF
jgi:hypothetical protein